MKDQIVARFKATQTLKTTSESVPTRPFFVDVSHNIYSIMSKDPDKPDQVGFNAAIGILTAGKEFRTAEFQQDLTERDKFVDEFVAGYIARVSTSDLREDYWRDTGDTAKLSRALVSLTASEFYQKTIGFDPLIEASQLDVIRDRKDNRSDLRRKRTDLSRSPLKRNDAILREVLKGYFTHKNAQAHANALVHMLQTVCREYDLKFMVPVLRGAPKLVPTIQMLRRLGKVPDLTIKEFQSLFFRSEWKQIQRSRLYEAEAKLKEVLRTRITIDNLNEIIKSLGIQSEDIHKDVVSVSILSVKRKRLTKASSWKRSMPKTIVSPIDMAKRKMDEEGTKDTFSPFEILAATSKVGAGEVPSMVKYDRDRKRFYAEENPPKNFDQECYEALVEYVSWLNS